MLRSILRQVSAKSASSSRNKKNQLIRKRKMSTCETELGPSRFLNIQNYGRVHIRETGPNDGQPLIFIPAALTNGDFWRKVVPSLSDKYRCICPDIPNGGHSTPLNPTADTTPAGVAELIKLIIDETTQPSKPPVIIANNTGGALTQIMLANHPDAVSKVVLTNCDAFENFLPKMFMPLVWMARAFPSMCASTIRMAARSPKLVRSPFLLGWVAKHPVAWQQWINYTNGVVSNPQVMDEFIRFAAGVDSRLTLNAAQTFPNFTKPVLLAWATEAPVFEAKWATKLAALFPNVETTWIADSYALVPEDNPVDLARAIRTFLDK